MQINLKQYHKCHFPTFSSVFKYWRNKTFLQCQIFSSTLSGQNPLKYVLFGLPHITLRPSSHSGLHPVLPVPFFTISFILTLDFHRGWLAEGHRLREAAVPQWSTTLPLSLRPFIPPPLHPPLPFLPLDWSQIEGSAGCGQRWERAWRDWGLSSHGRNGAGARRLIASQSATGKDVCLLLTKPMVKQQQKLPKESSVLQLCYKTDRNVSHIVRECETGSQQQVWYHKTHSDIVSLKFLDSPVC